MKVYMLKSCKFPHKQNIMLEDKDQNKENKRGGGRKLNSNNKMTKNAKKELLTAFEDDLQRIYKSFDYLPMDERFVGLKPIVKILCAGNDEVSLKTKEIVYNSLENHLKKLKTYFSLLPNEKKAIEIRQYLFCLDKEQIEEIFMSMKR